MDKFTNVTVVKKANLYFDGKVSSRTLFLADGSKVTLGLMQRGTYEFGTNEKEVMEIMSGLAKVLLPGAEKWIECQEGNTFVVPANSTFQIVAETEVDYCCSYVAE